jgi:hypothetical protein
VVPAIAAVSGTSLLFDELCFRWENHKLLVKKLGNQFLSYLDRYYTKTQTKSVKPLWVVGMGVFNEIIFTKCYTDVINTVMEQIELERNGQSVDRLKLKSAVDVFVQMGLGEGGKECLKIYHEIEEPFLAHTSKFYQHERSALLAQFSTDEYLCKVLFCMIHLSHVC